MQTMKSTHTWNTLRQPFTLLLVRGEWSAAFLFALLLAVFSSCLCRSSCSKSRCEVGFFVEADSSYDLSSETKYSCSLSKPIQFDCASWWMPDEWTVLCYPDITFSYWTLSLFNMRYGISGKQVILIVVMQKTLAHVLYHFHTYSKINMCVNHTVTNIP